MVAGLEARSHEFYQFRCDVGWGLNAEGRLSAQSFQREILPGGFCFLRSAGFSIRRVMEDDGVGSVEKFAGGFLEIRGGGIEYGQVEIGFEKAEDAVGFDNDVLGGGHGLTDSWHGVGEATLLSAHPPGLLGSGDKEARSVGISGAVFFLGDGPTMIVAGTTAGLAVGGADAVTVLSDFERGPAEFGQRSDEASDHAGLANAAGMSANDDDRHKFRLPASGVRLPASGSGFPASSMRLPASGSG